MSRRGFTLVELLIVIIILAVIAAIAIPKFNNSSRMAKEAALKAIEAAGKKPGKDIIIIGVDAVKGAFEAMMAGKMNVSVECNPQLGPQLMQVVKDVKAGKQVPRHIITKEGVFPMETAAKEFPNRKY